MRRPDSQRTRYQGDTEPAPARALSNKLLQNLYMIIPNETEAEILSGIKVTNWESAARLRISSVPKEWTS